MASERDGGSTYSRRSHNNFTQLITVCTRAGMGIGDGWGGKVERKQVKAAKAHTHTQQGKVGLNIHY